MFRFLIVAAPVVGSVCAQVQDDVCPEGGCGDEAGLLQTGKKTAVQAVPHEAKSRETMNYEQEECDPPCEHGGSCYHEVCICNAGYTGDHCESPDELTEGPHGDASMQDTMCGLGFKAYPYAEADYWGTSFEGWEGCTGQEQSPINICNFHTEKSNGPKLDIHYGPDHHLRCVNNGHALAVVGDWGTFSAPNGPGGSILTYKTNNIHFHVPSENTINGRASPMEMHIVHNTDENNFAVVGILFEIGQENECLKKIFEEPPIAGCDKAIGTIDLSCFSKELGGPYWSFDGSLTTPPCTEGLNWYVMRYKAHISSAQLKTYKKFYQMTARPTQPLYARTVKYNNYFGQKGAEFDASDLADN